MKKNIVSKKCFYLVLTISPLLLLSGCGPINWIKDKMGGCGCSSKSHGSCGDMKHGEKNHGDCCMMTNIEVPGGDWVVKVGDKVVVSGEKFQQEFDMLLEEKPQLKSMLPLMPNLEKDFAKGLGNQEVITKFIADKGLDKKPEYIQKKARMERAVMQMINTEFFAESFKTKSLSEKDVKKFYEDNKDSIQGILISRGGVDTVGVSFDKKVKAEEFLKKAQAAGAKVDLEKMAKDAGKKARDFKLINNQNYAVDPVVRTKVMALKKFPIVDLVSVGDKKFWVVHAKAKTETKYRPFEEVKDGIRNVAEQTEKGKQLQGELDTLSKKYKVTINDKFFEKQAVKQSGPAEPSMAEIMDQLPQSQAK